MKNSLTSLEYVELNSTLNYIFTCLKNDTPELIKNLRLINEYATELKHKLKKYDFNHTIKENSLSLIDMFSLTREIIRSIDKEYLKIFDQLVSSNELNIIDNGKNECSEYHFDKENNTKQINLVRKSNYSDIKVLIHEFIHYVSHSVDKTSNSYYFLSEFLAIYFEIYADEYMINIGIDKEKIDYTYRFTTIYKKLNALIHETNILIVYNSLGKLDKNAYNELHSLHIPIEITENFDNDCYVLLNRFRKIKDKYKDDKEECRYQLISSITTKLNYILGILLTFYARKNNSVDEMVKLNNSLNKTDEDMNELLMHFNINLNDENFMNNVLSSIDEYIDKYKSMVIK